MAILFNFFCNHYKYNKSGLLISNTLHLLVKDSIPFLCYFPMEARDLKGWNYQVKNLD